MTIKFGCHTSTWVLDYDKEEGNIDHIIDVVSDSGFDGIDIQVALLGRYKDNPQKLKEKLDSKNIELAALTVPFTWLNNIESEEERARGDFFIEYVKHFPNALLNTPSRVGPNRNNLLQRQMEIISCANALARRAFEKDVVVSFHPASPPTSYFRTESDYKVLFKKLDREYNGYTPDAGHIAAGGMNPVEVIKSNLSMVKHVHIKDCYNDFTWSKLGEGDIDFPAIIELLVNHGYNGWVMVEEETEETAINPDNAVYEMYHYISEHLKPLINKHY